MTTIEILERCKHGGHWRTENTTKPDGTCLDCAYIRERDRKGRGAGRAIPTYQGLIPGDWVDEARCGPKHLTSGVRFSQMSVPAKLAVCHGCPVKAECAELGKTGTDSDEVYGGKHIRPVQSPGPAPDISKLKGHAKRAAVVKAKSRKAADLARELRATGASWDYIRYTVRPDQSVDAFGRMIRVYALDAMDDELRAMLTEDRNRRKKRAK